MSDDSLVCNIKPILMFRFLFGFYYNCFSSTTKRYIFKTCLLIVGFLIIGFGFMYWSHQKAYIGIITGIAQYFVYFTSSFYTEENYVSNYYKFDSLLDDKKQKYIYYKLKFYLWIYTVVNIFLSLLLPSLSYFHQYNQSVNYFGRWSVGFKTFLHLANDLGRLTVMMFFALLYCRIKLFCIKIRCDISGNPNVLEWRKFMKIHIQNLKSLQSADYPLKLLALTLIVVTAIEIIDLHFTVFTDYSFQKLGFLMVASLQKCLTVFAPIIVMDMAVGKLSKLNIYVAGRMFTSNDARLRAEYWQFLNCLKERPLNYVAFRVMPLESRLLFRLLSLAVTYLVCLLQFSKKSQHSEIDSKSV